MHEAQAWGWLTNGATEREARQVGDLGRGRRFGCAALVVVVRFGRPAGEVLVLAPASRNTAAAGGRGQVAPPLSACNPPRRVAGRATQASLNPLGFFGTRGWNSLIWLLIGSLTPFLVSGGVMCSHFCFGSLNEWKLN